MSNTSKSGFGTGNGFTYFTDSEIGMTVGAGVTIKEISNGLGGKCWKATCRVESIFGQEIQGGELEGIGRSREEALERLAKERKEFNDSLWA